MATAAEIYGWYKNYLDENKLFYTPDEKNHEIRFSKRLDGELGMTDMLIVCRDYSASIYAYIVIKPYRKDRARIMEFLTRVNYRLIDGSFDMDPDDGEIRYKLTLNCIDRTSLSEGLIALTINTAHVMFKYYGDGLYAVMEGTKSPEDAIYEILSGDDISCHSHCRCNHIYKKYNPVPSKEENH